MIIVFLVFLFLVGPYTYAGAVNIPMGELAPGFTLRSVDDKKVSLSEYKGNVVILIYWRPDQNRSLLAMKDAQDIFSRYKNKGVQVISLIAETEGEDEVKKIIKDYGISFPVLIDSGRRVYGDYSVRVYPSTVIIDRNGKLAYDIPGHALTYKITLEGYLQYVLGEINEDKLREIISPQKEKEDHATLVAERRYNLAMKFADMQLIDQAIDAVKKSIEAKPDIAKSHILLGFLYLEEKDADNAMKQFNTALELDPQSHDAKTGVGGTLILKGDVEKAIEILNEALIANPYPQMTYYELGRAYELKNHKDKAIEMYKVALEKIIDKKILPSSITRCH